VLRDALAAQGLAVWLDEQGIETFESINTTIESGRARSKALAGPMDASAQGLPAWRAVRPYGGC
jgi:hypothetical protein